MNKTKRELYLTKRLYELGLKSRESHVKRLSEN